MPCKGEGWGGLIHSKSESPGGQAGRKSDTRCGHWEIGPGGVNPEQSWVGDKPPLVQVLWASRTPGDPGQCLCRFQVSHQHCACHHPEMPLNIITEPRMPCGSPTPSEVPHVSTVLSYHLRSRTLNTPDSISPSPGCLSLSDTEEAGSVTRSQALMSDRTEFIPHFLPI